MTPLLDQRFLPFAQLGILNGVYTGLGQSAGSLIGGHLCKTYGIAGGFKLAAIGASMVWIAQSASILSSRSLKNVRQETAKSSI